MHSLDSFSSKMMKRRKDESETGYTKINPATCVTFKRFRLENNMTTEQENIQHRKKTSPMNNTRESCETSLCINGRSLDKNITVL
jgi:hypothetical protein